MADQNAPVPEQSSTSQAQPQAVQPAKLPVEADDKFFAALGYFGPLFVLPLIVKPKSPYCKFHAKQSIVLFIISILVLIVLYTISWFGSILTLALFAIYILAIYKSYYGELWSIPFISNFAGKVDLEALYGKAGLALSGISGLKEKVAGLEDKTGQTVETLGKQEEEPKTEETPPEASDQK